MATATATQKLKALCDMCENQETDIECGNGYFRSRRLSTKQSTVARQLQVLSSEAIRSGMFAIQDGAIDGMKTERVELNEGKVKGRSDGVLSWLDCQRDPQGWDGKRTSRTVKTEMLYLHRDLCVRQIIGAEQTNSPGYFRDTSLLSEISQNRGFLSELHMKDARTMVRAMDMHLFMGNWGGVNGTTNVAAPVTKNYAHRAPNIDGVAKQILLQKNNRFFSTVVVTIPTIGTGCLYVEYGGKLYGTASTIGEALAIINTVCDDVTGEKWFSASVFGANEIRIVSNRPLEPAYGLKGFQLRYSADCDYNQCDGVLPCIVEENPMPFEETPFCVPFSDKITKDNMYDYWIQFACDVAEHCTDYENDDFGSRDGWTVGIDPVIYKFMDFARLKEICEKENAELYLREAGRMMPNFFPLRSLANTGGWIATKGRNFTLYTNTMRQLNNIQTWYDPNCGIIKSNNEMIIGAGVEDFCKTATNLSGSAFEKAILAAPVYAPVNLPHLCPEVRKDCCNATIAIDGEVLRASGDVCCIDNLDGTFNIELTSTSGGGLEEIDPTQTGWTLHFTDGSTAQVAETGDELVVTAVTAATKDLIAFVEINVTTIGGDTDKGFIPGSEIKQA